MSNSFDSDFSNGKENREESHPAISTGKKNIQTDYKISEKPTFFSTTKSPEMESMVTKLNNLEKVRARVKSSVKENQMKRKRSLSFESRRSGDVSKLSKKRRKMGHFNCGVGHAIKKPKVKKIAPKNYSPKFNTIILNKSNVTIENSDEPDDYYAISPTSTASKKFFNRKSGNKTSRPATVRVHEGTK